MVALGDLPGGPYFSAATGVSYNGSVVAGAGHSDKPSGGQEAFLWTAAAGMVGKGDLPGGPFSSRFQSISADGSVAVGGAASDLGFEAVRWTSETGMVALGDLPGGLHQSEAFDISADGSVIVGAGYGALTYGEAFRWTEATGMEGLGDLPGGHLGGSIAWGLSADGRVIVGQGQSQLQGEAFRWTEQEGMVGLGFTTDCTLSSATSASRDGAVIVGQSCGGFVWNEADGMRRLTDVLANLGVDLGGWDPYFASDISWDGNVIVGVGTNPQGNTEAWMAILHEPEPVPGDTDTDGDVDIIDFNNVRNNFGSTGLGDTDANGTVDIRDLNNVRNNFGAGQLAIVPEPCTYALATIGLIGMAGVIRQRKRR